MSRYPEVSDHAVLRYLERARGIDVERAREEVARTVARGLQQGACGVLINGLRYVLRAGRVVTVLDGPRSYAGEARAREHDEETAPGPSHE